MWWWMLVLGLGLHALHGTAPAAAAGGGCCAPATEGGHGKAGAGVGIGTGCVGAASDASHAGIEVVLDIVVDAWAACVAWDKS